MNQFKKLIVWQKSIDLAVLVYSITSLLPSSERFALISQINRSAVSIPSNIAEGAGRNSKNEFFHFLSIALGSSYELETQLIICKKLEYLGEEHVGNILCLIQEIQKMLYTLLKTLKPYHTDKISMNLSKDSRLKTQD
jgi:four helix bundle protein